MMDRDTLGYSGRRGSRNLRGLMSGDYSTFGAIIWRGELTSLTLLLLMGFETLLFEMGDEGSCTMYLYVAIAPDCHPHNFVRPLRPGRIGGNDWAL